MPLAIMQGPPPSDALVALLNEYVAVVDHVGSQMHYYKPEQPSRLLFMSPTDSWIDQIVYAAVMCATSRYWRETITLELCSFHWRGGVVQVYVPRDTSEADILHVLQTAERAKPDVFFGQIARRW